MLLKSRLTLLLRSCRKVASSSKTFVTVALVLYFAAKDALVRSLLKNIERFELRLRPAGSLLKLSWGYAPGSGSALYTNVKTS